MLSYYYNKRTTVLILIVVISTVRKNATQYKEATATLNLFLSVVK